MFATVLFIGGVSPDLTHANLMEAFSQHVTLLASSVVRSQIDGKCVGQAYVTVMAEEVPAACKVTQVGNNSVCVFPVDVDAWVAPAAPQELGSATFNPAAVPQESLELVGPAGGGAAAAGGWAARGGGGGGVQVSVPAAPPSLVHLQAAMGQLRAHLSSNVNLSYNAKPFYMALNEVCQKRQYTLQSSEFPEGGAFGCSIDVTNAGVLVCSGRGSGGSKRDAKHNAAAACLDRLLAMNQVAATEIALSMTGPALTAAATAAGGSTALGGVGAGGSATNAAAAVAHAQTQSIMRLGLYQGAEEVMRQVHGTDAGRFKTVLMVLNEYAARAGLKVTHDERSGAAPGGPPNAPSSFSFVTSLVDGRGQIRAQAAGMELRSKQEAKQAAAAAVIDYLIKHRLENVEGLARGRPFPGGAI